MSIIVSIKIYLRASIIFFLCGYSLCCYCQNINNSTIIYTYKDSIQTQSRNYKILHYHQVSKECLENEFIFGTGENLFIDSLNKHSRLILKGLYNSFDVPTIPLTHIFILENKNLILGLNPYVGSPYNIVLYSLEGILLYKAKISIFTIKMKKEEIKTLVKHYPEILPCIQNQNNILKIDDYYYLEPSNCIINIIGRGNLLKELKFIDNIFFPNIGSSTISNTATGKYKYSEYYNVYDIGNPLYDIIMIGAIPYLLILNAEDGSKVNIPLVSNCNNLSKELER